MENITPKRLWDRDASLWKDNPQDKAVIADRLGWLDAPERMRESVEEIRDFARRVVHDGFRQTVLLGMGGSSLCSDVLWHVFGPRKRWPDFTVLDSTDPDRVAHIEIQMKAKKTLFIVASKSGTTVETLSHFSYFHQKVASLDAHNPGDSFVCITDSSSPLEKKARENNFRKIFINPADIGGRFSALSFFGLVPAALMGIDIEKLLEEALKFVFRCKHESIGSNPGFSLGMWMGQQYLQGKDKMTFLFSPLCAPSGWWIEQLIAESLGKEGKGIVPVIDEPGITAGEMGEDRFFVAMRFAEEEPGPVMRELERRAAPMRELVLNTKEELAGYFFMFETATAVAASVMRINPFDEPDVKESKENTLRILNTKQKSQSPGIQENLLIWRYTSMFSSVWKPTGNTPLFSTLIRTFYERIRRGDYCVFLCYFTLNEERKKYFVPAQQILRKRFCIPVSVAEGPRYLHSTGQLYKGGPDTGIFVLITNQKLSVLAIPGKPYTFNQLQDAQAEGDAQALEAKARRLAVFNLSQPLEKALEELQALFVSAP